jgi:hypothetical protein
MKHEICITTDIHNTSSANMYGSDDGMLHSINSQ